MSLKLSELLNPTTDKPPNPSSYPAHSYPALSHPPISPESYAPAHHYATSLPPYSSHLPHTVTSSYEAASSLTALATSGASSGYPAQVYTQSSPLSSRDQFSPLSATFPALPPLQPRRDRRQSFLSDHSPTLPSLTTTLEQYHHRGSQSPDEVRRPSQPTFESGPQLAPITSAAPHQQGSEFRNALAYNLDPQLATYSHLQLTTTKAMADIAPEAEMAVQQPSTTQIREPSATAPEAKMTLAAPEPATRQPLESEPSPAEISGESTGTPREGTPLKAVERSDAAPNRNVDEETLKAIEQAKNDFGLRASRIKAQPSIEEPPPSAPETTNKKRPAPRVKKGQATVKKPAPKKRKVEESSATPSTRRSLSPSRGNKTQAQRVAGKKSKSNTPALGSSPAPGSVISAESEYNSGGEDDDEDGTFCICRKGDNHTWMIACDGGCEDWFHGKCVNILEVDGELIDKYICPNCEKTSGGKVTTWLPGCRNRTCHKPARIRKGQQSKYCSDECGRTFMEGEVIRSERLRADTAGKATAGVKPKRRGITADMMNGDGDASDEDLGPRGGALKGGELKALATTANDVASFRNLGAGVLSPPQTVSPSAERFPDALKNGDAEQENYTLSLAAAERIKQIAKEKDDLRRRRVLLKDREKFGHMIRDNVARYAEKEGIKVKDICGYDGRLAWGEEEFGVWRSSDEGAAAMDAGSLEKEDDGRMDVDSSAAVAEGTTQRKGMCTRKRCERHRQWQKQALADVRFEESQLADRMRALEGEEREVRETAVLRGRMEGAGLGGSGSVEVVMS